MNATTTSRRLRRLPDRQILEVSERERERFGRDLHDSLGQVLTGIALLSKGLEQQLRAQGLAEASDAARIKHLIEEAMEQTRAMARALSPGELEGEGLREALEDLASSVTSIFKVVCRVQGSLAAPVRDRSKATHLFRIAQEALSNALRHGKAATIVIVMESNSTENTLSIQDDGVGFAGVPSNGRGMGLRSMRSRAGVIGGTLEIRGEPAHGTIVTCRFH